MLLSRRIATALGIESDSNCGNIGGNVLSGFSRTLAALNGGSLSVQSVGAVAEHGYPRRIGYLASDRSANASFLA
jgi:hypothetical protein